MLQTKSLPIPITPLIQKESEEDDEVQRQPEEEEEKLQRQADKEEEELRKQPEEEEEKIQTRRATDDDPAAPDFVENRMQVSGNGQALPETIRAFFEPRFGRDLSQVRVHTDSGAAEMARSIQAHAFTRGRDIYFGAGKYNPEGSSGKRLLSHELTHVLQQGNLSEPFVQRQGNDWIPGGPVAGMPAAGQNSCDKIDTSNVEKSGTGVTFAIGSSMLSVKAQESLELFAQTWKQNGSRSEVLDHGYASVEGPADPRQRLPMNLRYSCERALAGKKSLIEKGVTASLIRTIAHGETSEFGPYSENRRVQVKDNSPGQPIPSAQDPQFRIFGPVEVMLTPDGSNQSTTGLVIIKHGDFKIKATVAAQATQASDFNDWEAGIVQMVSGMQSVKRACYKFPPNRSTGVHANDFFVSEVRSPNPVDPDRDNEYPPPIWMGDCAEGGSGGYELAPLHRGQKFMTLHFCAEDKPLSKPRGYAAGDAEAMQQHPEAAGTEIVRMVRFNYFITNVIARQISSGRIIPLYTVEWYVYYTGDFSHPGTGIPIEARNVQNHFQLIFKHEASVTDAPPQVNGKASNFMPRQFSWQKLCAGL